MALFESCLRDVPKIRVFCGSAHAVGKQSSSLKLEKLSHGVPGGIGCTPCVHTSVESRLKRGCIHEVNLSALTKITMVLLFLGVAFVSGEAVAQQSSDMEKVKAASQAFYAALNARDIHAMEKVWAHTPYVVHISPVAKEIVVGWEGVNKSWEEVDKMTHR